jgi:hypothetical protein
MMVTVVVPIVSGLFLLTYSSAIAQEDRNWVGSVIFFVATFYMLAFSTERGWIDKETRGSEHFPILLQRNVYVWVNSVVFIVSVVFLIIFLYQKFHAEESNKLVRHPLPALEI